MSLADIIVMFLRRKGTATPAEIHDNSVLFGYSRSGSQCSLQRLTRDRRVFRHQAADVCIYALSADTPEGLPQTSERILALLANRPGLNNPDICVALNLGPSSVRKWTSSLVDIGMLFSALTADRYKRFWISEQQYLETIEQIAHAIPDRKPRPSVWVERYQPEEKPTARNACLDTCKLSGNYALTKLLRGARREQTQAD